MRNAFYEPLITVRQLHDAMQRSFAGVMTNIDEQAPAPAPHWLPAVDAYDDGDTYVVAADIPGVDPATLEVTADHGVLAIGATRAAPREGVANATAYRAERVRGKFARRFTIPENVDAERITARYCNGVLEVKMPKKAALAPRQIAIEHSV